MSLLLPIASAITYAALAKGPAILCNVTPFTGGQNRNALLKVEEALAGTGVIAIEGNPAPDTTAPLAADAGWVAITTLSSTTAQLQEIKLPQWIRYNITASNASGTATITLQGIQ